MPPEPFQWTFRTALPEQTEPFLELAAEVGRAFKAVLDACARPDGVVVRARFLGDPEEAEERGRAFWLDLHGHCLDQNLALELAPAPAGPWGALSPQAESPRSPAPAPAKPDALASVRPEIPAATLYDLLRSDDPEMEQNLAETTRWIESRGLPVINLLSYLDLPMFLAYAAEHPDERDQNLYLHMLHTWTCYRHAGQVRASIPADLAARFADPRYLRLNTTQFRSPAPALCLQFADWSQPLRPPSSGGRRQWAKEVYLTHLEPPTPSDDRELTLMIVSHDEGGEFGFIPLEVPLSLPGVGQSIDAFFAPSEGDEELGANTEDLHRISSIAATYCLYAVAGAGAGAGARFLLE